MTAPSAGHRRGERGVGCPGNGAGAPDRAVDQYRLGERAARVRHASPARARAAPARPRTRPPPSRRAAPCPAPRLPGGPPARAPRRPSAVPAIGRREQVRSVALRPLGRCERARAPRRPPRPPRPSRRPRCPTYALSTVKAPSPGVPRPAGEVNGAHAHDARHRALAGRTRSPAGLRSAARPAGTPDPAPAAGSATHRPARARRRSPARSLGRPPAGDAPRRPAPATALPARSRAAPGTQSHERVDHPLLVAGHRGHRGEAEWRGPAARASADCGQRRALRPADHQRQGERGHHRARARLGLSSATGRLSAAPGCPR